MLRPDDETDIDDTDTESGGEVATGTSSDTVDNLLTIICNITVLNMYMNTIYTLIHLNTNFSKCKFE